MALPACTGGGPGPAGTTPPSPAPSGPATEPASPGSSPQSRRPSPRPSAEVETISAAGGTYYAIVDRADPRHATLTVDVVQFFTGAAAARACAQDGIPDQHGALCHAYYIRDRSRRQQTLPIRPDAPVTAGCGDAGSPTSRTVAPGRLVRLTIAHGVVTRLDETCLP
jgi:hypothetical protein